MISSSRFQGSLSVRQSEATACPEPAEGRNLTYANPRFLFPPVMALCARCTNGMTSRELLDLVDHLKALREEDAADLNCEVLLPEDRLA